LLAANTKAQWPRTQRCWPEGKKFQRKSALIEQAGYSLSCFNLHCAQHQFVGSYRFWREHSSELAGVE